MEFWPWQDPIAVIFNQAKILLPVSEFVYLSFVLFNQEKLVLENLGEVRSLLSLKLLIVDIYLA